MSIVNDDQTLLEISKRLGEIKERATIESDEDFFAIGFAEGFIYGFARLRDLTDAELDQQIRQAKGGVGG